MELQSQRRKLLALGVPPKRPAGKKRGGQHGHEAHHRALLPPEKVSESFDIRPEVCCCCGTKTCARLPTGIPRGAFGPRLQAVLSLLAGAYRLGKRPIQSLAADLSGLTISAGMACKLERGTSESLEAPVEELREYVRSQHAGADEASWRENRSKAWL